MDFFSSFLADFFSTYGSLLKHIFYSVSAVITLFGILIPLVNTVSTFRASREDKRFENYHQLIDELVGGQGNHMIDRQIAIIYELRYFKKYRPVTKRILTGLKSTWSNSNNTAVTRVVSEIDLTLKYLDKGFFRKLFCED